MSVTTVESYLYFSECGVAAAMALLSFDYCLTFSKEVSAQHTTESNISWRAETNVEIKWVFDTRWTPARLHELALYALRCACDGDPKYVGLDSKDLFNILATRAISPSKTSYCGTLGTAKNAMYYLCIVLAEAMLVVRTYVFWKRDKRILIGMCAFAVVCTVIAIAPSQSIFNQPTNPISKSLDCVGVQSIVAMALRYIGLIIYEMGMLSLNWVVFRRMKKHNSPGQLITTLYRDGMMYMAIILLFSVINAMVALVTPIQYSDSLNSLQVALHSVLASRIFFNLRETGLQEQENQLAMTLSEFHAAPHTSNAFLNSSVESSRLRGGINIEVTRESVVHVQDSNA